MRALALLFLGLSGCIATVPRTTAKAVPRGTFVIDGYAGMTVQRYPTPPAPIVGDVSELDPALAAVVAEINERETSKGAELDLGPMLGASFRTGFADRADVGLTVDTGGALLDAKLQLVDLPAFAFALDVGAGEWEGHTRGVQLQGGVLLDAVVGDVRATLATGYGLLLGDNRLHLLQLSLSAEVPLTSSLALVPALVAFIPLAGKDAVCPPPVTVDELIAVAESGPQGQVIFDEGACDEARRQGFVATVGLRLRLGG